MTKENEGFSMTSELEIANALLETAKEKILAIELKEMEEGLRFNIFRILDRFDDEEKGHSAFLAELLNPKGKHGRGNLFLNLFIDNLKEEITNDKLDGYLSGNEECNFFVETEKSTMDGRIDILIRSDKLLIAIENKIYAEDQPKQLERYKQYLNSFKAENVLIYLTLYGYDPSNASKGILHDEDYYCISYDFIVAWLKACLDICKITHLKTIIEQYIQCVETLTGKTGTTMTNELSNLLIEPKNLDAAIKLSKSINHVKTSILNNFLNELYSQVNTYVQSANKNNQMIKLELN
ncbi:MAG: PD-(D/E)XK nuclease family protein [Deltaproteobacteria bacterium]|nr:PD-(D/E)XK nuclease family protein [Deltaproteobacteria bacterium]